jgi:hypothetical protein
MDRRRFVSALATAPFLAGVVGWIAGIAGGVRPALAQFPMQGPDQNPGAPPGMQLPGSGHPDTGPWSDGSPQFPTVRIDPHAVLEQNQKNIQKDVNHLFDLAQKLKKQISQTDSSEVLSLNLLDTVDEIEKLAKHIKNLAKA